MLTFHSLLCGLQEADYTEFETYTDGISVTPPIETMMLVPRRLRQPVTMCDYCKCEDTLSLSFLFYLSSFSTRPKSIRAIILCLAQRTFTMDTRIPSSTRRSAPPAQGVEGRHLPSYGHGQPQRGEGSASRLPIQISATAATRDARPPGMVAPSRVGTPNRDERPVSTATTSSHSRYSPSYQSITPNSNRPTAVAGASHYRPTSTASQPEYGDSGYHGWARRNDRLAALRSPVCGHEYAAAGIVRSYHHVPSSLRSEDAYSTQSPLPSLTESDNASASVRWGDPTGALRHATQAVAPSVHSQAGKLTVATTTTHREDSVAPISRYSRPTHLRAYSTPAVPSRPVVREQRSRTYLDMHPQYEHAPAYRPPPQQVDWGSNFSPDSPGYTLQQIRQRRSTLSVGFPRPQNALAEHRVFAGPFVDTPSRITATSNIPPKAARGAVKVKPETGATPGVEEDPKTPGKWRKVSGLFKLGRKEKCTSPDQVSPATTTPPTSHSASSPAESPPETAPKPQVPPPRPATPFATRAGARRRSPPPPLPTASPLPRPTAHVKFTARNAQNSPVSPLSEADAHQGTEGLSPVSPLSENPSPSDPPRPKYTLRAPPPVPGSALAEKELLNALNAASALPRSRYRDTASRRRLAEAVGASSRERVNEDLTLEEMNQDLLPSPLVVQKRWKCSPSPRRTSLRYPAEEIVGDNANWGNAQEMRVIHKGKGKLVNSRSNSRARSRANSQSQSQSQSPPPPLPMERSRPVVVEAPGPKAPEAEAAGADEGDGKERRDTTFAVAELAEKAKGEWKGEGEEKLEEQDEDVVDHDDTRSNAPSWRTDDSHKFSHCVADALKLERLARKP